MNTSVPGIELRQHKRRHLHTTAHVALPDSQVVEVRTTDISAGGLAIIGAINPKVGETLFIRFGIPVKSGGRTTVQATVKVAHSIYGTAERNFKIGLRFLKLEPEAVSSIAQYVG
ncbi:MAG: PilZ domain-containing protein [Rhodocyclaceae bacterium]|nr:PilZ domain-containing protein [Rhodocyclaceae bacterium]MCA3081539.1 PilZ domain-containing protein [Rhodocyclaceae bacterium]